MSCVKRKERQEQDEKDVGERVRGRDCWYWYGLEIRNCLLRFAKAKVITLNTLLIRSVSPISMRANFEFSVDCQSLTLLASGTTRLFRGSR